MTSELARIRILSAGAPKMGVRRCAEAHARKSGDLFSIEFATAPEIEKRLRANTSQADIIVAPSDLLSDVGNRDAIVLNSRRELGSIATGVAVRNGVPVPELGSLDTFRNALLNATRLIYNRASSGQYIEKMIDRLGISKAVADRTVRTDTGKDAMKYLARDRSERAIAFGQSTEIRLHEDLGLRLVGSLPGALENRTFYSAALTITKNDIEGACRLMEYFRTEDSRKILIETGVETGG